LFIGRFSKKINQCEKNIHTSQLGTQDSKRRPGEKYPQAREFDSNGKPIKTIDFFDHGETPLSIRIPMSISVILTQQEELREEEIRNH
jgi:hypothetical protein